MGAQTGVIGGGNLAEQLRIAVDATPAGANNGQAIVAPAVQNGTVTSNVIDRRGFNSVVANFNVGAIVGAGNYTVKVQHSADGLTGWTDAATTDATPSWGATATAAGALATANTDVNLATDLRLLGRYIRYVGTLVSGTSVLWGATAVLGAAENLPQTAN